MLRKKISTGWSIAKALAVAVPAGAAIVAILVAIYFGAMILIVLGILAFIFMLVYDHQKYKN